MKNKEKLILQNHNHYGLDRRGFLECMAWAGTGMLWTVSGGVIDSTLLPSRGDAGEVVKASFSFARQRTFKASTATGPGPRCMMLMKCLPGLRPVTWHTVCCGCRSRVEDRSAVARVSPSI